MNKKRKSSPTDWSWTSKLYNASSLAETVLEQSEEVENLTARLAVVQRAYQAKVEEVTDCKQHLRKWSTSYESLEEDLSESNKLSASLFDQIETLKVDMNGLRASHEENNEKITLQDNELAKTRAAIAAKDAEIASLQKELHCTKRESAENRARKKSWKKKYEELAHMGATALAKQTRESYGVSPDQFEAYKTIVATQFEVDKAQHQREEAFKLLHANANALEDKQ